MYEHTSRLKHKTTPLKRGMQNINSDRLKFLVKFKACLTVEAKTEAKPETKTGAQTDSSYMYIQKDPKTNMMAESERVREVKFENFTFLNRKISLQS